MTDATQTVTLAVDCMGGDHGLATTLPACVRFLESHPAARLLLVGQQAVIEEQWGRLKGAAAVQARIGIVPASEVVTMDDPVEIALRKKKDSSMRVAILQVKEGRAQAAVSAGNTGALMAVAR